VSDPVGPDPAALLAVKLLLRVFAPSLSVRLAGLAAFALALAGVRAEPPASGEPVPGRLIERVVCAADAAQSYAVYLPSNYDPGRAWPILYCFDPRANGKRPVGLAQAAAERLGYIVVGSNNSRNGSWQAIELAARHLVRDTQRRFRLDPRRRYSMGFSGGSRAASAAAAEFGFAGVIGCGAGLPDNGRKNEVRFVYFGAVGDGDFNYSEMQDVMSTLATRKVPHRLAVFPGAHEWLPASVADEALTWFELQAMRSGARDRESAMIDAWLSQRLQRAAGQGETGEAWLEYQQIAADFEGLADTTEASRRAGELKGKKPVRAFVSAQKKLRRQENEWLDRLYASVAFALNPPERDLATEMFAQLPAMGPSMSEPNEEGVRTAMPSPGISASYAPPGATDRFVGVRRLAAELAREQAANAAARRVLGHRLAMLERANWAAERGEIAAALVYAETAAILQPDAADSYFVWARVCAKDNQRQRARELLALARTKGFADTARLAELEQRLAP
jgi:dienelactone hydrolase